MYNLLLIIFIIVDIFLIFLIVIQNGIDSSGSFVFDSVKSNSLLTSFSKSNTLVLLTACLAVLFFVISLVLCNINYQQNNENLILTNNQKFFSNIN